MKMPESEIAQTTIEAARAGGEVLRKFFRDGVVMRNKESVGGKSYDLVSDADIGSERVIANLIRDRFPGHEILGEEGTQEVDLTAEHLWIIDPLDGTNNFAHRIPHFAVSVGYYHLGVATAGAVWNPIRDDLFTVVRGGGAWHNGEQVSVSDVATLDNAMIGCGFYYDRGEMMRATLRAIEQCFSHNIHGIRRFGTASLDLCMVGSGILDAFFEFRLSPWDFAAGSLFLTEAGGQITTASGQPLPLVASSVLATNAKLHPSMLDITSLHDRSSF